MKESSLSQGTKGLVGLVIARHARASASVTLLVQSESPKVNPPANSSTEPSSGHRQSAEPSKRLTGQPPPLDYFGVADDAPPNDNPAAAYPGIGSGIPIEVDR